mmetsp:Transcript_20128/g.56702  ORF Transcript_20128/g.56702 Transcript_20128/m.56702 type:complete len:216 (-) Transcript_20128:221-868(-)
MRAVELARAVANPDQVGAQVVVLLPYSSRERLLEVQLHRLVRREELGGRTAGILGADLLRAALEGLEVWRVLQSRDVDRCQSRGVRAGREGPEEVQRGGGVEVALEQALWVPLAVRRGVAVDVVALEGHDLSIAFHHLCRLAARLAVLARNAGDAQGRLPGHVLGDHAHLEDELQLSLEAIPLAVDEALGAVPALDEEALTPPSLCQQGLQALGL